MKEICARFLFLLLAVAAATGLALVPLANAKADALGPAGDQLVRAAGGNTNG